MAPALTETNQEDNFKLPHSPNTATIINSGITQSSSDRYTCNIPFQILPTKCNIFIGNIGKSDVELNCYSTDKLASNNSHLNGNMLEKSRITSDSFHSLSTVFGNGTIDSLTNGVVDSAEEKSKKSANRDMCELSKLVAQKLVHSDATMHCIDRVYMNDRNLKTDTTNTLPIKINGELITDSTTAVSKRDNYIPINSPNLATEEKLWTEASERMEKLQQDSARLMKRIRHLQTQQAATHVKNEIGAFVSYGQSRLDAHHDNHKRLKLSQKPLTSRFQNISSSALISTEKKKLHNLRERQAPTLVPTNTETKATNKSDIATLKIDPKDCAEINRTVGTLRFNLSHLGWSVDSDITDSSSGGESCEEAEDLSEKKRNPQVPVYKRAVWKWSVDRAEIANRWIWLQAQILDLEQRIRRLNSLCHKLRSMKKSPFQSLVQSDGYTRCECEKQSALRTVDDSKETIAKPLNGYITEKTGDSSCKCNHSESCLFGTSRTRPFDSFRKRKLYRVKDVCLTGTKASRLSSVKCSCKSQENLISCILCSGQYNKTFSLEPEMISLSEKTALLEPNYHSVLSSHEDIPLSFHFEMLLKRCRISRQSTKIDGVPNKKHHLIPHITSHQHKRRYRQAKKVAEILLPSAASIKRQRDHSQSLPSSPSDSRPSSPNSYAFLNQDGTSGMVGRRRRESAYDINNIVIPCCIVPAIRIEKLQYKEILTPKWRILSKEKTTSSDETQMETVEDLSDEAFLARHQKCEAREKKWFTSYIRVRTYGRGRSRNLRFDVVPSSPHSFSNTEDCFSGSDDIFSNPYSPGVFSTISSSDMSVEEETKDSLPDEEPNDTTEQFTEETVEIIDKKPYDRRTFPLTDEQYEEMLMEANTSEHKNDVFLRDNFSSIPSVIPEEV